MSELWTALLENERNRFADAAKDSSRPIGVFLHHISVPAYPKQQPIDEDFIKRHVLAGKGSERLAIGKKDYQAKGVMYLPPKARFSKLLDLPEGENIGKAINEAMRAVEAENEELKGVLPKTYNKIDNSTLVSLLKTISKIAMDADGDTSGKIYEYFPGNFARAEGQKGGELFTPRCVVRVLVVRLAPYKGRVYDPCCGSAGMFVQSEKFVDEHGGRKTTRLLHTICL